MGVAILKKYYFLGGIAAGAGAAAAGAAAAGFGAGAAGAGAAAAAGFGAGAGAGAEVWAKATPEAKHNVKIDNNLFIYISYLCEIFTTWLN